MSEGQGGLPRLVLHLDNEDDSTGWIWDEDGNRFVKYHTPADKLPLCKCSYCFKSFRGSGALSRHLQDHNLTGTASVFPKSKDSSGVAATHQVEINQESDDDDSSGDSQNDEGASKTATTRISPGVTRGKRAAPKTATINGAQVLPEVPRKKDTPNDNDVFPEPETDGEKRKSVPSDDPELTSKIEVVHVTEEGSAQKPKYKCKLCQNVYPSLRNVTRHLRGVHLKERLFQCPTCSKSYYDNQSLQIHMNHHIGFKPYNCTICPTRFYQKNHLQLHLLVHSGTRPYQCDICDKAFYRRSDLKLHQRKAHQQMTDDK